MYGTGPWAQGDMPGVPRAKEDSQGVCFSNGVRRVAFLGDDDNCLFRRSPRQPGSPGLRPEIAFCAQKSQTQCFGALVVPTGAQRTMRFVTEPRQYLIDAEYARQRGHMP